MEFTSCCYSYLKTVRFQTRMRRARKDGGIFRQKQTAVRVNFNRLLFKTKL